LNRFGPSRKPCVGNEKGPALPAGGGALQSTDDCYLEGELDEELLLEELFFL
jgi:hypothetical protein